jgi:hypothetical protein
VAPFLRKNTAVNVGRLSIAAAMLLFCGCLMSPDINVEPEEALYPPEIVLSTLSPGDEYSIIPLDSACTPAVFKVVQIQDLNKKDTLYARFLPDWEAGDTKSSFVTIFINPTPGSIIRQVYDVEYQQDLTQFSLGDIHSLRLFVSDRRPDNTGNGMELTDNPDGQYDFYQWTFQVVEEGSGICASDEGDNG